MRRIIVSINVTLDGFMADADGGLEWQFEYWTNDLARLLGDQLSQADALVLGRNTYKAMASYWPYAVGNFELSRDDLAYAILINDYPKIVCSSTLKKAHWKNTRIIKADVLGEVSNLKQGIGKNIMVYGSRGLAQFLLQQKLVDELQLWVYPVTLGQGLSFFKQRHSMTLLSTRQFASGVVVLSYKLQN